MIAEMSRQIVFSNKKQVAYEEHPLPELGPDDIHIKSIYSLISIGTETIALSGDFEVGTGWANWVKYPFKPGYSCISQVLETGTNVTAFKSGDIIAGRFSHASEHVVKASEAIPVPDGVKPIDAVWFALAKIAYVGARAARYSLGGRVVIIGAGPIGQMSVRWASAAGQSYIGVVDIVEHRLEFARRGGATHTICASTLDARAEIEHRCGGTIPEVIIDTTGNAAVFADVLRLAPLHGRFVLLGDTGCPDHQHLTHDLMKKGISVIGAHDSHIPEAEARLVYGAFFEMVRSQRVNLDTLITHVFAPEECQKAYEMLNTRRGEAMGVIFDWSRI